LKLWGENKLPSDILAEIVLFFRNLFDTLRTGVLFFGGPVDIILAIVDIFITTSVVYYVLKLIRDSRAWQLLKGIILIVIFAQIFSIIGLQTIGFILTNTLSVLAIAFVVIFQPELRRALETVGRSSFTIISGVVNQESQPGRNTIYSMIDSIVRASEKMIQTYTGALIIIERETQLGELSEQDNAVIMDSAVSATLLLQIFYKGSPLHDGAVLIRNGRINAARCHVPLSDNYNLRKDYGTRHRAAIGASEMGDAIAVVLSEERGAISIAIDGRLFTLDNPDALRTVLHKYLDTDDQRGVISQIIKGKKVKRKAIRVTDPGKKVYGDDLTKKSGDDTGYIKQETENKSSGNNIFIRIRNVFRSRSKETVQLSARKKIIMLLSSFLIAFFIWLYVQITINPVETRTYSIPLQIEGIEQLEEINLEAGTNTTSITVTLKGRSKNLTSLSINDIEAVINLEQISDPGRKFVPVSLKINKLSYFRTENLVPSSVVVDISEKADGSG